MDTLHPSPPAGPALEARLDPTGTRAPAIVGGSSGNLVESWSFHISISGLVRAEMFPAEMRALGVGLAYALANAVFGGAAECVALRFKDAGHEAWFAWYATAPCAVSVLAALQMPDRRRSRWLRGEGVR